MAKFVIIIGLVLLAFNSLFAQSSNQWINYNQQYFKIPVTKNGIYNVTVLQLQPAGFPVGYIDPQTIQLFDHGKEKAIIVDGESDAQFNPTDVIKFFGSKNDGTLDVKLYDDPSFQPHTYTN